MPPSTRITVRNTTPTMNHFVCALPDQLACSELCKPYPKNTIQRTLAIRTFQHTRQVPVFELSNEATTTVSIAIEPHDDHHEGARVQIRPYHDVENNQNTFHCTIRPSTNCSATEEVVRRKVQDVYDVMFLPSTRRAWDFMSWLDPYVMVRPYGMD